MLKVTKSCLLAIIIITFLFSCAIDDTLAVSPDFKDVKGHWAENVIMEWKDNDLIRGYSDGTFKPESSITRGEFITLVNREQK